MNKNKNIFNSNGFSISSLLYPIFIIIITISVLVLTTLLQSSFSMNKITNEIQGDLTDNNTMKSLKESTETVLKESKDKKTITWVNDPDGKINLYNVTQGNIKLINQAGEEEESDFTTAANTTDWKGRFFTESDGTQFLLVNNGTYCAYKTGDMSGVAVYNSGDGTTNECVQKLAEQTNCSEVIAMMDDKNTVTTLQNQVADLQNQINDLKNQNTEVQDFLKAHPIGSIYVSTSSTNPGNKYTGSTWVAYAGGRTLVGAGSTTDSRGAVISFSGGQTGGEYNQALTASNLPNHTHSYSATGNIQNGWFDGPIYTGSCRVYGNTGESGAHAHSLPGHTFEWGETFSSNVFNNAGDAQAGSTPGNALATSQGNFNRTNGVGDHHHWIDLTGTISGSAHGGVSGSVTVSGTTGASGSNSEFNIQNPYIVVYMWQRTA